MGSKLSKAFQMVSMCIGTCVIGLVVAVVCVSALTRLHGSEDLPSAYAGEKVQPSVSMVKDGEVSAMTIAALMSSPDTTAVILINADPAPELPPLLRATKEERVSSVVSTALAGEVICFDSVGDVTDRFQSVDHMLLELITRSRDSKARLDSLWEGLQTWLHSGDWTYLHELLENKDINHDGHIGCMSTKP